MRLRLEFIASWDPGGNFGGQRQERKGVFCRSPKRRNLAGNGDALECGGGGGVETLNARGGSQRHHSRPSLVPGKVCRGNISLYPCDSG